MKNILLIAALLISCSDQQGKDVNDIADSSDISILVPDSGINFEDKIPEEEYEYACAMTYVQIPYLNTAPDSGIETELYSHQLWSMPVRRLKESSGYWIAFLETRGVLLPDLHNADFTDPSSTVYANIILADGTELFEQSVRPGVSQNEWQVCETYNCGPNGCQTYVQFESAEWKCKSILNNEGLEKCPCIFNTNNYTYCDLSYGQEKETADAGSH